MWGGGGRPPLGRGKFGGRLLSMHFEIYEISGMSQSCWIFVITRDCDLEYKE